MCIHFDGRSHSVHEMGLYESDGEYEVGHGHRLSVGNNGELSYSLHARARSLCGTTMSCLVNSAPLPLVGGALPCLLLVVR